MSVYLDLTHIPKSELDRKLGGILEIYEKFQGVDPRIEPMRIFPAVHYSMGGLWADYVKNAEGGLASWRTSEPHDQHPRACMRSVSATITITVPIDLGANSLLSCIFTGLFTGSSIVNYCFQPIDRVTPRCPSSLLEAAVENATAASR